MKADDVEIKGLKLVATGAACGLIAYFLTESKMIAGFTGLVVMWFIMLPAYLAARPS